MFPKPIRKEIINPGEFVFAEPGTQLQTVLGSCIAITLWHPKLKIGGMCHFVLPSRPANEKHVPIPNGRYGDEVLALFELASELHRTSITEYQAKIFGGSDLIVNDADKHLSIGTLNTEKAVEVLTNKNVNILMAHVGESGSRLIVMELDTGDVWVKHNPSKVVE